MATRRTTTRTRTTTNSHAPSSSSSSSGIARPRSVVSRARPELTTAVEEPYEQSGSTMSTQTTTKRANQLNDGGESHIQVVIRCRRRSEREIQEGSPIIISSEGPRGQNITIETAAPSSVLGVVTLPPTRTYPFDVVFGPEADQSMVYHDVVHPMLEEVLKGYNCTLFAYGQTGTGKTHTMQGDVSLTPLGNPSAQAGMIPRALFKLFHQLESSGADYSVKISYVELYNEELRDLLASEFSAPQGSAQPMSMGSSKENPGGLKIFDDSSKKGVFIQGLEDTPVKDFNDALALLAKGSQRRQIAATKFNDHSSRSHSVFSITVHSKETSSLGDDLLKVGKLNLVDLAGSENIGRSGAENKRAREAGMINQSLLTLGRVINALVDRSSHVPYRESKLTRLLQDSLGGRTKTCIIATVSPARSNMEETLSTLDYAIRAKSIRNKPEVNQRMTRNALLKEYVGEIERLKSDVLAAREKNGIYFSEETWTQLSTEHEMRETEVEEAKKQVDMIESQMRSVREEFEQSIALLMKTDGELKHTKERLRTRENELEQKEGELTNVKVALEEEVVLRKAHAASEDVLDSVAGGLKKVVEESTNDVAGLFSKIDRKKLEFDSKAKVIGGQSKLLDAEAQSFLSSLVDFVKVAEQSVTKTQMLAESFQKSESASLTAHYQLLDEQMKRVQNALKTVQSKEDASEQNLTNIWTIVKEVQDRLANELSAWSASIQSDIQTMCVDIEESGATNFASAEHAMNTLGSVIDRLVKDARTTIENERKATERQSELVSHAARQEIARLKDQNAHLTELLELEKKSSMKAKDTLIKRVSSLLVDFTEDRDRGLRDIVYGVQETNKQMSDKTETFAKKHDVLMSEAGARGRAWSAALEKTATEGILTGSSAIEALQKTSTSVQEGLSDMRSSTTAAIEAHSDGIIHVSKTLNSCSKVFEREHKIKRARIEATTHLGEDAQSVLQKTRGVVDSASKALTTFGDQFTEESSALHKRIHSHASSGTSHVSAVQQHNRLIFEQGTRQNPPTGSTPQKRKWQYVDKWEKTQSRSDLLYDYRRQHGTVILDDVASQAFSSELPHSDDLKLQDLQEEDERGVLPSESGPDTMSSSSSVPANNEVKMEVCLDPLQDSQISSSATLSDEPIESIPIRVSALPVPKLVSSDSETSLKSQPVRTTLQEKSTNIANVPRPTRMARARRR
ncbi:kinesin-domain-containing protein [Phellopilus nigrolimitatus]|nr:kinesin-domain-containing protein [Phellopilus nigrolimitatus]